MPSTDSAAKRWFVLNWDSYGRRGVWIAYIVTTVVAAAVYYDKAADDRSAFLRWRHQVLEFWEGKNIWDEYFYPNPPIMPISLTPLMLMPRMAGAMTWFGLKAVLTAASIVMCLNLACPGGWRKFSFWATGLVVLLALRPILSDLHHGNNNLLILFLIVSTLYAWTRGFDIIAGLVLGLAITYKVTPALFLPYFLYKRSWKTSAATLAGVLIFLFVVPSVILGPERNMASLGMWWHRTISPFVVGENGSEQEVNQSLVGVLTRFLTPARQAGDHNYGGVEIDVTLLELSPWAASKIIKGICLILVGLLAVWCRTPAERRTDTRLMGEFSLVVLTMLFVSERSWKHHYVTLLLPYTYLVYRMGVARDVSRATRWILAGVLALSALLIASTSSDIGKLFGRQGHKFAQAIGMFLWAGVVLYAACAWRVLAGARRPAGADDLISPTPTQTSMRGPHRSSTRRAAGREGHSNSA